MHTPYSTLEATLFQTISSGSRARHWHTGLFLIPRRASRGYAGKTLLTPCSQALKFLRWSHPPVDEAAPRMVEVRLIRAIDDRTNNRLAA